MTEPKTLSLIASNIPATTRRIFLLRPALYATVLAGFATTGIAAPADELSIWSAGAAQAPMTELVRDFQNQTGVAVKIEFAPVGTLMKRLAEGGKPDLLILSQDVSAEAEGRGWTVPGSSQPIASVGVGVAVRAGAAVPDISTADALRVTLLNARSITYIDPAKGTSGKHFSAVLEKLGIARQMEAKTTLGQAGYVVEPVARGEIEIGIQQITEILPVQGAMLVGPLPEPLQKVTTYTIATGSAARAASAARDFRQYVLRPPSIAIFKARGFTLPD